MPRGKVTRFYARRSLKKAPLQQLQLDVRVEGTRTTALIDSGASHNFASQAFVEAAKLCTRHSPKPLLITLANGAETMATHEATVAIEFPGPDRLT